MISVLAVGNWDEAKWIILILLGLLVVGLLLLGLVWLFARRWLRDREAETGKQAWDLQALREMRDRGELSDAEYDRMRAIIIGSLTDRLPGSGVSRAGGSPVDGVEWTEGRDAVRRSPGVGEENEDWDWVSPDFDLKKGSDS